MAPTGVGVPTKIVTAVVVGAMTAGTAFVSFTFAVMHMFSTATPPPGAHAAALNLTLQGGLLAVVLVAWVVRRPRAAWLRSAPVMALLALASMLTVFACVRLAEMP